MYNERVVLTGASGRLGQALVPRLRSEGYFLILVGRDELKLRRLFPTEKCVSFETLAPNLEKNDVIVYLAARNNDQDGTMDDFRIANVDKALTVFEMAEFARVKRFIFFQVYGRSTHLASRKRIITLDLSSRLSVHLQRVQIKCS